MPSGVRIGQTVVIGTLQSANNQTWVFICYTNVRSTYLSLELTIECGTGSFRIKVSTDMRVSGI